MDRLDQLCCHHFETNYETNFIIGSLGKTYEVNVTVHPARQDDNACSGWIDEDWDFDIVETI